MKVSEFETAVWEKDRVKVVVRAPAKAVVGDFDWQNAAAETMTVTDYLNTRVKSRVGPFEAVIVGGNGVTTHGGTKIKKVRETYKK